jgi:hypothetical protein
LNLSSSFFITRHQGRERMWKRKKGSSKKSKIPSKTREAEEEE